MAKDVKRSGNQRTRKRKQPSSTSESFRKKQANKGSTVGQRAGVHIPEAVMWNAVDFAAGTAHSKASKKKKKK